MQRRDIAAQLVEGRVWVGGQTTKELLESCFLESVQACS